MKTDIHFHPFSSVLIRSRAAVTPVRPALSYREAGGTGVSVGEWIPPELRLPETDEAIEQGRQEQRQLFADVPDDSRAGRLQRLLRIEGMTTANRLPIPHRADMS
jgi:hypothetical protein